jgi:hypothetical protein
MRLVIFLLLITASYAMPWPVASQVRWPSAERLNIAPIANQLQNRMLSLTYDSHSHTLWSLTQHGLSSVRLDTDTAWVHHGVPSGDPQEMGRLFASTVYGKTELLNWDESVGRVWRWSPGMNAFERLDDSFRHSNQIGHAAWVDEETSSIYAYGGYGLWTVKNFFTRFDTETREWHIVYAKNADIAPMLFGAFSFFNRDQQRIYLTGGSITQSTDQRESEWTRPNTQIWSFDRNKRVYLPPVSLQFDRDPEKIYALHNTTATGEEIGLRPMVPVYSESADIFFSFLRSHSSQKSGNETSASCALAATRAESGETWFIGTHMIMPSSGLKLLTVFWREDTKELILFVITSKANANQQLLYLYRMPMHDFLKELKQTPVLLTFEDKGKIAGFLFLAVLLVTFSGFGLLRYAARKKQSHSDVQPSSDSKEVLTPTDSSPELKKLVFKSYLNRICLLHENKDILTHAQPLDAQFLMLLILEHFTRGLGIETFEIADVLYVGKITNEAQRKMRSETHLRLKTLLKTHTGFEGDIFHRTNSISDHRRAVYILNKEIACNIIVEWEQFTIPKQWHQAPLILSIAEHLPPDHTLHRQLSGA